MTHSRHNQHHRRAPLGLIAVATIVLCILLLGVVAIIWRGWLTFSTMTPWVAWLIQFILFGSVASAPVVLMALAWRRWADHRYIQAHHMTQLVLAQQSRGLPKHLESLSFHDSRKETPMLTNNQPLQIEAPAPVAPPTLIEAINRQFSTPEQWLIGMAQDGQPQVLTLKHTGFIALGGIPGTGKTNAAALLAAQCAAQQGMLFVADPQAGDTQSLATRIAPLGGIVRQTPNEINAMIATIERIYMRRVNAPSAYPPLLILLDEFLGMMLRKELTDESLRVLLALAGEGRKKNMYAALCAQNWNIRAVGGAGVAIRQLTTATLVFKSKKETAETLLPLAYAQQALTLKPGQTLFFGADEPVLVTVPWLSDADMAYAARGRNIPPMPASPAVAAPVQPPSTPAAAPLPPTVRVPVQPAPPTMPLTFSLQEQIIGLLRLQPWLTSSQIAQALRADLKYVRTELTPLARRQIITRRPTTQPGDEKYEYAVSQSVSGRLTPTA